MPPPVQLDVALAHVAVGANAASNALSGNRASTANASTAPCAAFAAKNGVVLVARDASLSSSSPLLRIQRVLQHRGATRDATRITSVYLHASPEGGESLVLAGDSESNVLLWTASSRESADQWKLARLVGSDGQKIAGSDAVSAVTALRTRSRWLFLAAFSSGHVAVWQQRHGHKSDVQVQCVSVSALGVRTIMETLAATLWTTSEDEEEVLVAAGGVDSKVHLFEIAHGGETLAPLLALEGHRGWIRAVDFERRASGAASSSMLLASASQDHRVRLWKISAAPLADAQDPSAAASSAGFQAAGATQLYTVSFDSLLIAHEDWVTSLAWTLLPAAPSEGNSDDPEPALVSTSMDNTVILWRRNERVGASGAWVASLRVGEHGGNGVLSSVVLPTSDAPVDLLALSLTGQLERWRQQPAPSKTCLPAPSLTGHTSPVTDLSWSPRGDYVISLSLDQTTRVLAPWRANGSWHEISRAQVHGYDINCGAFIQGAGDSSVGVNDRFVCGADEKILRVFEAPDDVQTLVNAMNGQLSREETPQDEASGRVEHAYLPELSLTNKSTEKKKSENVTAAKQVGAYALLGGDASQDQQSIHVPVGDTLAKKTLWPELRKLYGHGNELLCVASNHAGTLLASACKSREEKFAAVWLWRTSDWGAAQTPLEGHKSSVVQLAFSPNDAFLLSVSKDRQFCVFAKREDDSYALSDRVKAHKRIIWSCSWAPDSSLFATGSRDQTFALWGRTQDGNKLKWTQRGESVTTDSAVTAVAFAPWSRRDDVSDKTTYLLAVGLESGAILVYAVACTPSVTESVEFSLAATIPLELTPTATITRLAWSPSQPRDSSLQLASASADHSVRVFTVELQ